MRDLLFLIACGAFVHAGQAGTLCCGRGAAPVGARPTAPLEERASPWRADFVLMLDPTGSMGPLRAAIDRAVRRVKAVDQVEVDPRSRWLRAWTRSPVAVSELCTALRSEGVGCVPALESRLLFGAGEKGRVARAGRVLSGHLAVADFEVEVDGEHAVARVWVRAGVRAEALVNALGEAGIRAGFARSPSE